jgi:hypothetical protein
MVDRKMLRLAATLSFVGLMLTIIVGLFHPGGDANNHPAVFAEYAASGAWTAVHFGQFVAMAVVIAGLLALFLALAQSERPSLAGRFGAVSAGVALALYGVLQGVDGVALKQSVDAWVRAAEAEKPLRFAAAETVRWLEWGVRSYQTFTFGLAFVLYAAAIAATEDIPRPICYLMGLSGLVYIAQGWFIGAEGFSPTAGIFFFPAYALWLAWSLWLLVFAWRMKAPPVSADARPLPRFAPEPKR